MPQRLFIFIQLEFPWALGPADGRYLLRLRTDAEPERVVVIGTLEPERTPAAGRSPAGRRRASMRERLGSRGAGAQAGPEPARVTTTRVTIIDPISLSAQRQARAWLDELDRERDVLAAVAVINRVLHSHRIASADPYVHEVAPTQALVIRAGWGEGEQVAAGRWLHVRELPWRADGHRSGARRRGAQRTPSSALRPQERLAALLGARGTMLLCEELTLRARLDLDHGRLLHAAVELDRAISAAVLELRAEGRQDLALRIAELEQLSTGVAAEAHAALAGAGREPDEQTIAHALGRLEAALRARTATGVGLR
jgi:hypothetical protein